MHHLLILTCDGTGITFGNPAGAGAIGLALPSPSSSCLRLSGWGFFELGGDDYHTLFTGRATNNEEASAREAVRIKAYRVQDVDGLIEGCWLGVVIMSWPNWVLAPLVATIVYTFLSVARSSPGN